MLKISLNTLQNCSKVVIQRTTSSKPTTLSSLRYLNSLFNNGCCKGMQNTKSVIWKLQEAMTTVLLDKLCNKNLIIFKQFKKRVFGSGNKTFENYKKYALFVGTRLEVSDFSIQSHLLTWKKCLRSTLCDCYCIVGNGEKVFIRRLCSLQEPKVQLSHNYTSADDNFQSNPAINTLTFDAKNPFMATVIANRELHTGGDRSCMHIELSIKGSNMHYDAGDHVAIYPINDINLIERLGKLCHADLDTVIPTSNDSSKKHPFPCATTYRKALTHYLEITALPKMHILKELTEYCTDEVDKEFLRSMTFNTSEGKEKYKIWIQDSCRNIVHILEDIKSCKPPIDYICTLLPRLQPRYYSISSSSKVHPTSVHITAVLVKYKTASGRINNGVATAFLKKKQTTSEEVKLPIFISKSRFHLPVKPEIPIIMVGPGTGLAPFRGFVQERHNLRDEGKVVGDTILYFGCRNKNEDFIYKEELEEYVAKGTLTLKTAFSRDQEKKIYVTHLIEQDADLLWKLIGENKGHFYICGDARNIAVDVKKILVKIVSTKGNMSEADAVQYLKNMETDKRYMADVWS